MSHDRDKSCDAILTKEVHDIWTRKRPEFFQNKNCDFSETSKCFSDVNGETKTRNLTSTVVCSVFSRKLTNGECVERKWLLYSPSKKPLYGMVLLVFPSNNTLGNNLRSSSGYKDGKLINNVLREHENNLQHRESIIVSYVARSKIVGRLVGGLLSQLNAQVRQLCKEFQLTDVQVNQLMSSFLEDIKLGLGKDTHPNSIVKCFITYVQDLPNGKERGKFLALDLGGTNFRVLVIHLSEKHFDMKAKIFAIPQKIMVGTGTQLFDHIAECLVAFVKEHQLHTETLPLGFTFSFPLMQKGLSVGILERWTKGFNCSGVIGQDVVQLLRESLDKKPDVKINIAAVLNDTTGTLMSCAWKDHNTKIGLIIGTGTNSCYVEKTENAELFDGDRSKPYVIINTESGAFGDDGKLNFIRTEYDKDVDDNSINPGRQLHEKMISGMYMGEIVRLIAEKAVKMNAILGGKGSDALLKRGNFFTKYVSEIESDKPGSYTNVKRIMNELGLPHATEQDYADIRHMCEAVSSRAGVMVSASMATLLNKMGFEQATIGIDGSLYRFHPGFADLMTKKISQLVKPGIKFKLMLSEDGSGRGAALVAAVASRGD